MVSLMSYGSSTMDSREWSTLDYTSPESESSWEEMESRSNAYEDENMD